MVHWLLNPFFKALFISYFIQVNTVNSLNFGDSDRHGSRSIDEPKVEVITSSQTKGICNTKRIYNKSYKSRMHTFCHDL